MAPIAIRVRESIDDVLREKLGELFWGEELTTHIEAEADHVGGIVFTSL